MRRRTYLYGLAGAASVPLAGCTEEEPQADGGGQDNPTETETKSPEPESGGRLIAEETIYTKTRYPEDLKQGQQLVMEAEVMKGGPLIVDMANRDTSESIFQDTVDTEKTMKADIKNDGTHYITFQGMDKAHVKVTVN